MKTFASALLLASAVDARHKKQEPKKDPFRNDPVDLRPALVATGSFYYGLVEGAFGEKNAPEGCLDIETATSFQGLVHAIAKGDFNNVGKLFTEGTEIANSMTECDFKDNFEGFFLHCQQTNQCELDKIQKRLTNGLMKIMGPAQEIISTATQIKLNEDLELLGDDFETFGKDFGKLLDLIFHY